MPAPTPPSLQGLAERLLQWETRAGKGAKSGASAAFRVCAKLRLPLARLMGVAGFRSIFSRALALAVPQVPWLSALHIKPDGALAGLDQLPQDLSPDALSRGEVVLVSQLLGLLETFIGLELTVGLLHEVWPKKDLSEFESST